MRRSPFLVRTTLALALALGGNALVGCEDENDPKTWVNKLGDDAKRASAVTRLRQLFDGTMSTTTPPQNTQDPRVRAFLDTALPTIVTQFSAHADETIFRRESIEILAQSKDVRAVPALVSALSYRPGNADSERIALRAAQALKELAPQIPEAEKARVAQALLGVLERATGATGNPQQIRYHSLGALGALRATSAVDAIVRILTRPLAEQDISTARGAADALGEIGDARGVDALLYGLFLNIRAQNAFPHCKRALARIGAQHAVPRLVVLLNGQNTQVNTLMEQYANVPNAPQVPPGYVKQTAADVLGVFGDSGSVDPLLAVLNNRQEVQTVRHAAADALAYVALANPAQKARILAALLAVFNEAAPAANPADPSLVPGTSLLTASSLALVGDPSALAPIAGVVRSRPLAEPIRALTRVDLIAAAAQLARRADVATVEPLIAQARTDLRGLQPETPGDQRAIDAALAQLDKINSTLSVARDCADGDVACYTGKLTNASNEVVTKAAYMLAWSTQPAQRDQVRTALLARIDHPSVEVRRVLMVAIDAVSPAGAPAVITRLEQLITAERAQESKIISHLDAQLLIARLRARAAAPAGA